MGGGRAGRGREGEKERLRGWKLIGGLGKQITGRAEERQSGELGDRVREDEKGQNYQRREKRRSDSG